MPKSDSIGDKKIFELEVIALRDNRTAQIWIHILKWYRFCEHL